MLQLKFHINTTGSDIDLEESAAMAEQFAEVMTLLNLDYDLAPDVLAEAESVLQAMRVAEKKNHRQAQEVSRGKVQLRESPSALSGVSRLARGQ